MEVLFQLETKEGKKAVQEMREKKKNFLLKQNSNIRIFQQKSFQTTRRPKNLIQKFRDLVSRLVNIYSDNKTNGIFNASVNCSN